VPIRAISAVAYVKFKRFLPHEPSLEVASVVAVGSANDSALTTRTAGQEGSALTQAEKTQRPRVTHAVVDARMNPFVLAHRR